VHFNISNENTRSSQVRGAMRAMLLTSAVGVPAAWLFVMHMASAADDACTTNSSCEDSTLLHLRAGLAGPAVRCALSSTMCAGNQCCPGVAQTGYKTYPCPSADLGFTGCEAPAPDQGQAKPVPQGQCQDGTACVAGQCCPGIKTTGYKTYPCPVRPFGEVLSSRCETDTMTTTAPAATPDSTTMTTTATAVVDFDIDAEDCSIDMTVAAGSVQYANAGSIAAGRVVSTAGYKNLKKISFDVDLTGLAETTEWTLFKNAAIYLISNPEGSQPIGANYCDQGGNNCAMDCIEIDLMESNGPIGFQTTIHSAGDSVCGGPQLYEFWYPPLLWDNLTDWLYFLYNTRCK